VDRLAFDTISAARMQHLAKKLCQGFPAPGGRQWFDMDEPFRSMSAPPLGDRLTVGLQTLTLPV
jgi:hypothetical protein